jgi:hypothetical protein
MKYRLSKSEAVDGYNVVNGRNHGFKWKPKYEVTFTFDTPGERKRFIANIKDDRRYFA